jgi:hypothetical protein
MAQRFGMVLAEAARKLGHGGMDGGKVLDVRYHILWRISWKSDQM